MNTIYNGRNPILYRIPKSKETSISAQNNRINSIKSKVSFTSWFNQLILASPAPMVAPISIYNNNLKPVEVETETILIKLLGPKETQELKKTRNNLNKIQEAINNEQAQGLRLDTII